MILFFLWLICKYIIDPNFCRYISSGEEIEIVNLWLPFHRSEISILLLETRRRTAFLWKDAIETVQTS
jgi:hypothetical protein